MALDDRFHSLSLFADLQTRKLTTRDGSSFTLSPVTVGDTLLCTLTVQQRIDAEVREVDLPVRSLVASIGRIHEPPTKGSFTLATLVAAPDETTFTSNPEGLVLVSLGGNHQRGETLYFSMNCAAGNASVTYYQDAARTLPLSANENNIVGGEVVLGVGFDLHLAGVPDDGFFTFEISRSAEFMPGDSAALPFDATAEAVQAVLLPLFPDIEATLETAGCWLVWRTNGEDFSLLEGAKNRLEPASFVRIRKFQRFGTDWAFEVRLVQQPIATNETGFSRVLAPPPRIERIDEGSPGSETTPATDEIQALKIHPDFRGTYTLNWQGYRSRILGIEDGPDQIAEALNAMFEGSTLTRFEVTVAEANQANIQFVGPLGGEPHPEITANVVTFSPGVLTFALPLTRAEAHHALRLVKEVEMPFEVSVEIGDPNAPQTPGRELTLFRVPLKIERELNAAGQNAVQKIEWHNPRPPLDYIPFTRDQIIFGSQHYIATFGNGFAREWGFLHNLGTSAFTFLVRENKGGGRALYLGIDYAATFPNDNALALALLPAYATPDDAALAIVISSAGPTSAFQAHTHTIEQILTLDDILATLAGRLENLEDLLPSTTVARREERTEPTELLFPDVRALFPGRIGEDFDLAALADGSKTAPTLPRPGALVPAIHDATVDPLPLPLPVTAPVYAGRVFQNMSGAAVTVPGSTGSGRDSKTIESLGHVGNDGRFWYKLTKHGATNSFFPTDLERELVRFHVSPDMWQPGEQIEFTFEILMRTFSANSNVQCLVVIDAGTAPQETTPAPVGPNLEKIQWAAKPLLETRVLISAAKQTHKFGVLLKRSATGNTIEGERLKYTAWTQAPADSLPTEPGVVLRAQVIGFDTENNEKTAKGFVFLNMTEARATIA